MDGWIPLGRGYSIGLDPILGLIPGFGDLVGTLISSVIILQAQRAGLPRVTVLRMMVNVAIDSAVGAIPFVGDVFDFAFKANRQNLELYRQAMRGARKPGRDARFLVLVLIGLVLLIALPVVAIVWLVRALGANS